MYRRLRHQAQIGFLATVMLALFIGVAALFGVGQVVESQRAASSTAARDVIEVDQLWMLAEQRTSSLRAWLATADPYFYRKVLAKDEKMSRTLAKLRERLTSNTERQLIQAIEDAAQAQMRVYHHLQSQQSKAQIRQAMEQEVRPLRRRLDQAFVQLKGHQQEQLSQAEARAETATNFAIALTAGSTLGASLLIIAVSFLDRRKLLLAYQALESSEGRMAGIVASAMDAIITIDEQQRVVLFNTAAEQTFGYRADEIIGQKLETLLPARFRERHSDHVRRFGEMGTTSRRMGRLGTLSGLHKNGQEFPIEATISHCRAGKEQLYTVIIRDVTERILADQERDHLLEERLKAVRVRDEFLSVASHELRTPLATLNLQIDTLLRSAARTPPPEPWNAKFQVIRRQTQRLTQLVDDLLNVSQITSGKLVLHPEELDLGQQIADLLERFHEVAQRQSVTLSWSGDQNVRGTWDRLRLEQILSNLLSNAIKYGSGRPVTVTLADQGRQVTISVRDQGIGIAEADQNRIFERFERAVSERHYGGLGLGLWISSQIVARMGGTIAVNSTLGEGSTFTVTLPKEPGS